MARFNSLPDNPHLSDVFKRFPRGVWRLMEYHDALLRGDSDLSIADREFIAAFVSGVNACSFCHGSHKMVAELHGIDPDTFEALMTAPENSNLPNQWQPLLSFLRKLTETPALMTDTDAAAVFEAGWSEDALFDAISICGLFNMMNRIVEGCGVTPTASGRAASRQRHSQTLASKSPYQDFARSVSIKDC